DYGLPVRTEIDGVHFEKVRPDWAARNALDTPIRPPPNDRSQRQDIPQGRKGLGCDPGDVAFPHHDGGLKPSPERSPKPRKKTPHHLVLDDQVMVAVVRMRDNSRVTGIDGLG